MYTATIINELKLVRIFNEVNRVFEYNGEIIISESKERYDVVKNYLNEINKNNIDKSNRIYNMHEGRARDRFPDIERKIRYSEEKNTMLFQF